MSKFTRFLVWVVVIAAVLIALGRLLLFESWTVPEDNPWLAASLEPTLRAGDVTLLLVRGSPGFGDLVRCADPDNPNERVVGRIAGVEGDLVEVMGPVLLVNGTRYDSSEVCQQKQFTIAHPDTGAPIELSCARVELGGTWHFMGSGGKHNPSDDKRHRVGEGKVFLLSDNRTYHDDSRDFGTVDLETCDGRVVFRLWGKDGWGDSDRRMDTIR